MNFPSMLLDLRRWHCLKRVDTKCKCTTTASEKTTKTLDFIEVLIWFVLKSTGFDMNRGYTESNLVHLQKCTTSFFFKLIASQIKLERKQNSLWTVQSNLKAGKVKGDLRVDDFGVSGPQFESARPRGYTSVAVSFLVSYSTSPVQSCLIWWKIVELMFL